jgi:cytoskeletal protein RodZ
MRVVSYFAALGLFASLGLVTISCAWKERRESVDEVSQALNNTTITTATPTPTTTTTTATTTIKDCTVTATTTTTTTTTTTATETTTSECTCNDPCREGKFAVCHVPADDPAKAKTLCVGNEDLPGHLSHGDVAGPCPCAQVCN